MQAAAQLNTPPDADEIQQAEEEDRVGRLASLPTVIASGILAALVLFAGLTAKAHYDQREDYKAIARYWWMGTIPKEMMPADPGIYANLADVYSRDMMPPDHERALAMITRAVELAPLDSRYWMRAAEQDMLMGRNKEAVVALGFSDLLDPRWPDQRLNAVRLWRILGNRTRAMELGTQIAALGPTFRETVANELLDNGFPTNEVLEAIDFRDQSPEATGRLISGMSQRPGVSLEELWQAVPEGSRKDGQLRAELAKLAVARNRFDLLLDLWSHDGAKTVTLAPGLVVKNTDLRQSPLGNEFELGWQPPIQDTTDVRTTWVAPVGLAGDTGKLDIEIGAYAPEQLWWPIYRLIIPADMAVDLGARLSVNPGVRTVAEVRLLVDKEWLSNVTTSGANDKAEDLRYAVLPSPQPRLATIFISWRRAGITDSLTSSNLKIHSVLVRPLPRFTPSSESGS